jgi:hypothetical protein
VKKPTVKQGQVLDSLRAGMPFDRAYRKAGLSESYENKCSFLERLISSGLVTLVPITVQEEMDLE